VLETLKTWKTLSFAFGNTIDAEGRVAGRAKSVEPVVLIVRYVGHLFAFADELGAGLCWRAAEFFLGLIGIHFFCQVFFELAGAGSLV
jgi:hypothetical protein